MQPCLEELHFINLWEEVENNWPEEAALIKRASNKGSWSLEAIHARRKLLEEAAYLSELL